MNLFGVLFVRGNARIDDITQSRKDTYSTNKRDAICILLRLVCNRVVIRIPKGGNRYRNISFERVASANDKHPFPNYLNTRKVFAFLKYMGVNV